jgi:hypothetical protein
VEPKRPLFGGFCRSSLLGVMSWVMHLKSKQGEHWWEFAVKILIVLSEVQSSKSDEYAMQQIC